MTLDNLKNRLLESSIGYRLWQAPFAEKRFRPVPANNDMSRVRRVLDIGCGPGINTHHFSNAEYLGIDCNEDYIESARLRHGREFLVQDVTTYNAPEESRYDFILLNSFLHHIGDEDAERILSHTARLLAPNGHIHILDLVLPEETCLARWLARMDRGEHPRFLERWRELFEKNFDTVLWESYSVKLFGMSLWHMVYFKGKLRQNS